MGTHLLDQRDDQLVAEKSARSRIFEPWGVEYC